MSVWTQLRTLRFGAKLSVFRSRTYDSCLQSKKPFWSEVEAFSSLVARQLRIFSKWPFWSEVERFLSSNMSRHVL